MTTQVFNDVLTVICCANCGIAFGMPDSFDQRRREDHKGFYCPNGHRNYYPQETQAEKLRRQLDRANARNAHLSDQLEATERSRRATKGQLTKIKKRVANGVCPCCNRHFNDLQQHMHTEHPDYVDGEGVTP